MMKAKPYIFMFDICVYLHQAENNLFVSLYDSKTLLLSAKQILFKIKLYIDLIRLDVKKKNLPMCVHQPHEFHYKYP